MEKIAYTVQVENGPSLQEWLAEFRVGILAPKSNDRALDIMRSWDTPDFSKVISKLEVPTIA
jgi:hypothetical protein